MPRTPALCLLALLAGGAAAAGTTPDAPGARTNVLVFRTCQVKNTTAFVSGFAGLGRAYEREESVEAWAVVEGAAGSGSVQIVEAYKSAAAFGRHLVVEQTLREETFAGVETCDTEGWGDWDAAMKAHYGATAGRQLFHTDQMGFIDFCRDNGAAQNNHPNLFFFSGRRASNVTKNRAAHKGLGDLYLQHLPGALAFATAVDPEVPDVVHDIQLFRDAYSFLDHTNPKVVPGVFEHAPNLGKSWLRDEAGFQYNGSFYGTEPAVTGLVGQGLQKHGFPEARLYNFAPHGTHGFMRFCASAPMTPPKDAPLTAAPGNTNVLAVRTCATASAAAADALMNNVSALAKTFEAGHPTVEAFAATRSGDAEVTLVEAYASASDVLTQAQTAGMSEIEGLLKTCTTVAWGGVKDAQAQLSTHYGRVGGTVEVLGTQSGFVDFCRDGGFAQHNHPKLIMFTGRRVTNASASEAAFADLGALYKKHLPGVLGWATAPSPTETDVVYDMQLYRDAYAFFGHTNPYVVPRVLEFAPALGKPWVKPFDYNGTFVGVEPATTGMAAYGFGKHGFGAVKMLNAEVGFMRLCAQSPPARTPAPPATPVPATTLAPLLGGPEEAAGLVQPALCLAAALAAVASLL